MESLEPRQHFTSSAVVQSGTILTITGTDANDDISIAAGVGVFKVFVNGDHSNINYSGLKLIRIDGNSGDDKIVVSPKLKIQCIIDAGEGNDRVGGGKDNDTIWGGSGNDTLAGNAGNDYVDGGSGDDYLYDPTNDDNGVNYPADWLLHADVIHGGIGNDRAYIGFCVWGSGIESVQSISAFDPPLLLSDTQKLNNSIILNMGLNTSTRAAVRFYPMVESSPGIFVIRARHNFIDDIGEVGWPTYSRRYNITDAVGKTIYFRQIVNFKEHNYSTNADTDVQRVFQVPLLVPHTE